jgi:hypothetical protein
MSVLPNEGNPEEKGDANANSTSSISKSQPLEANFAETIANLQRKLDAQEGEIRALKSGKDSALDRIEKTQKDTFARIASYLGVDEAQVREAQRNFVLDELVSERLNNPLPARPIVGTVAQPVISAELQDVDNLLDLPANDPRVTDLHLKYGHDLNAYKVQAKALKASLPSNTPTPAEQLSNLQGVTRETEKSVEQLTAQYQNEMLAAPRGKAGASTRAIIKDRYKKQGVPVDNIAYT